MERRNGAARNQNVCRNGYFCFEGDALWNSSAADLVALATRELDR